MRKIIILIIGILLLIPLSISKETEIIEPEEEEIKNNGLNNLKENNPEIFERTITKCKTDNDCYKIESETCCPCSSGGIEKAVNKKGIKYYNWYHSTCSGMIRCILVFRCTERKPICKERKCVLR